MRRIESLEPVDTAVPEFRQGHVARRAEIMYRNVTNAPT
jgi:hypothetical protein